MQQEHEDFSWFNEDRFWVWAMRCVRGVVYFLVALVLLLINTYGITNVFLLAVVIGVLGVGHATARVGLAAIAVLLAMAVLPVSVIDTITTAAF